MSLSLSFLISKIRKIIVLPYRVVVKVKWNNVCENSKIVPGTPKNDKY